MLKRALVMAFLELGAMSLHAAPDLVQVMGSVVVRSTGPLAVAFTPVAGATTTVSFNGVGQPVTSTMTNVAQFGGSAVVTGVGASGLGIPRVTISNDSTHPVTQSGAWIITQSTIGVTDAGGSLTVDNAGTFPVQVNQSTVAVVNPSGGSLTVTHGGVGQPVTSTFTVVVQSTVGAVQVNTWTVQPGNTQNTTSWLFTSTTPVALPGISKGVQASTGITTQELKDSGRSMIILSTTSLTPASSDTILTIQKNVDGSTSAVTTYTITNGKTLRIQGFYAQYDQSGTTAARVQVRVRLNTAGTCTATSPILLPFELSDVATTATALTGYSEVTAPFPDGIEISGNGTKSLCMSAIGSTAAGTLTLSMVGYEY